MIGSFSERQRNWSFNPGLITECFDLVKKKSVDQERVMRARWVLTWKSTGKAKARLCVLGFQDPDLTEVPRDSPTLSGCIRSFDHAMVGFAQVSPDLERHQDSVPVWR